MNYLFVGGPYHDTQQNVISGRKIWNLPEPLKLVLHCYPGPITDHKFVVHTYRRLGLTHRGEFPREDRFLGYIFVETSLSDEEAIELFLELKRN